MNLEKRSLGVIFWLISLFVALFSVVLIAPVKGAGIIYIRADGSVDPQTAPIASIDNVTYTLMDDIYGSLVVERNFTIIDGAEHGIQGTGQGTGFLLSGVSNVTVKNARIVGFQEGIMLVNSSNCTIFASDVIANLNMGVELSYSVDNRIINTTIVENRFYGILLISSSGNLITGNSVARNQQESIVLVSRSSKNTVSENNITDNASHGIWICGSSSNNTLRHNYIAHNGMGVLLESSGNILRRNIMVDNDFNFGLYFGSLADLINDVDASNKVDGRPIYYWISTRDLTVPEDAGYVALVNSTNITVKNLNLQNNIQGMLVGFSQNLTITQNNITFNHYLGIDLFGSSNNSVYGNKITNRNILGMSRFGYGIRLFYSSYNRIFQNDITDNYEEAVAFLHSSYNNLTKNTIFENYLGITIYEDSSFNSITGNDITSNSLGIGIYYGLYYPWNIKPSNNSIFHNNFVKNSYNVYNTLGAASMWDNGYPSGGNYWSTYAGTDEKSGPTQNETGSDGIIDTPYVIDVNNTDRYPLMYQWDVTPPITIDSYDKLWHNTNFEVFLDAQDKGRGVAETFYKINNGTVKKVNIDGQPLITVESSDNSLEYWSVDKAGNEELPHKVLTGIKLDKTAPSGSITINNGTDYTASTEATLTLNASDGTSGVAQMRLSNDNLTWAPWEQYLPLKTVALTLGDGTKSFYVQYQDNAGLVSTSYKDDVILDMTPPEAIAGQNRTVNLGTEVDFDASGSTDNTRIVSYEWNFGDGTMANGAKTTHKYTSPGLYKVTLTVRDAAGNNASSFIHVRVILTEGFPVWILGGVATVITISFLAGLLLRRREQSRTKRD